MKRLKLNLSGFDLGCIIAFVVLTILGVAGWWYLSGNLATAQDAVTAAKADFDKVSTNAKYNVIVSSSTAKNLQDNVELLKKQIDPILLAKFLSKDNSLGSISNEDSVAWKHDLDDQVTTLNTLAKTHNVTVPDKFYYGFSSYLTANPNAAQTGVLKKQLAAIDEIAKILISAPARSIGSIRRTYEENASSSSGGDVDHLPGHSLTGPAHTYTAYPFEVDFEATTENFRDIVDNLVDSPYVFIIRSISIQNSNLDSPRLDELDKMAGTTNPATPSVVDASPGEVAAAVPTKGPQYLFGNSFLKVKMRLDLVEWNAGLVGSDSSLKGHK